MKQVVGYHRKKLHRMQNADVRREDLTRFALLLHVDVLVTSDIPVCDAPRPILEYYIVFYILGVGSYSKLSSIFLFIYASLKNTNIVCILI